MYVVFSCWFKPRCEVGVHASPLFLGVLQWVIGCPTFTCASGHKESYVLVPLLDVCTDAHVYIFFNHLTSFRELS